MNVKNENVRVLTKEEVIKLSNGVKRREFLDEYESWGVWLDIPELNVQVYKTELPMNRVIYVTRFKNYNTYGVLNETEYHVELFGGKQSQLVVVNEEKPSLKIVKTDALTDEPIQGVGFLVKHAEGSTENTVVTDENGEAFLEHLAPGIYEVTEKSVPDGYLLDTEPKLVTLEPNRTSTVRFKNYPKPSLTINKVDAITKDGIEGAKFHIIYASNNTFSGEINDMGEYQTDENGQIKLYRLKDGWYKITETEAPDGYKIDESAKEIYIKAGENKEVTFDNTPLSGLVIKKVDGVTGKVLQGAKFRVRYLSGVSGTGGTVIGEYTTSANGTIVINRLKAGSNNQCILRTSTEQRGSFLCTFFVLFCATCNTNPQKSNATRQN